MKLSRSETEVASFELVTTWEIGIWWTEWCYPIDLRPKGQFWHTIDWMAILMSRWCEESWILAGLLSNTGDTGCNNEISFIDKLH